MTDVSPTAISTLAGVRPTLLDISIRMAVLAHRTHRRNDGRMAYIAHPFDVLNRLANWGINDDVTWSASLFHDVDEETAKEQRDWLAKFCAEAALHGFRDNARTVQRIVCDELTYIPGQRWASKEAYLESFPAASVVALAVKKADRICNTINFHYEDQRKSHKRPYAPIYFKKAEVLGATWMARQKEIEGVYGLHVWRAAMADWDELKDKLAKN